MSTLAVNDITPANAGSETYFLAKAWVNFNGNGTVAIRASGNVSSIGDNGVGDYTVNFASNITDTNYGAFCQTTGANNTGATDRHLVIAGSNAGGASNKFVGSIRLQAGYSGGAGVQDFAELNYMTVR